MTRNDIIVPRKDFEINHILDCGQIFRYEINNSHSIVYALDKKAILYNKSKDECIIECEDKEYFQNFFDLECDYGKIKNKLIDLPFMKDAIKFGHGIRILRQDIFEMIISFIISANNNIPRIKSIINKLCINGRFPSIDNLLDYTIDDLKKVGLGYRADYIYNTVRILKNNDINLNEVHNLDGNQANKYLTQNLKGVGPKVADCILLFAYHKMDVFPVDTWIRKVYKDIYSDITSDKQMRTRLISTYKDLSGFAQQYLFYHKRELNK